MPFIEYEKAFYLVDIAAVLAALNDQRIDETCIRLMDVICRGYTARIIFHNIWEDFPIIKGVRQGDSISPKLFTACLEGYSGSSIARRQDYG